MSQKNVPLQVRLKPDRAAQVAAYARAQGITESEAVRRLLAGGLHGVSAESRLALAGGLGSLGKALAPIAGNLHQLVESWPTSQREEPDQLAQVIEVLRDQQKQLAQEAKKARREIEGALQ